MTVIIRKNSLFPVRGKSLFMQIGHFVGSFLCILNKLSVF